MRFRMLATDYDNTIATRGVAGPEVRQALEALRRSGRLIALVTGRTVAELDNVFDDPGMFDALVLENGALVRTSQGDRLLGPPVPAELVTALRRDGVAPLAVGRGIISTPATNTAPVRRVVAGLGLDLAFHHNRDSLMLMPTGIDKALGLEAAAAACGVAMEAVVAVGDGENDCSMIAVAGAGVAVANATEMTKGCAGLVLDRPGPEGVIALCASMLEDDLAGLLSAAAGRR
ncbi:MAG: HAD family phosphatase [Candidatus Dormibacteraeota bacterium]|nr:HAD family phosphatase [Candidatus Dormibacteraeota bacterium]